ncbi:MAG: biotin--[acetyl-CoA-carboxylase] ligase [Armatimonadetes bacterium]|nr:biotin--[acetyl-CoA-carboxylase] ligase [Armatimonadota bacterium]
MNSLDTAAVAAGLVGERLRGPVLHFREITSTNDIAADLARAGHPEGTVVIADHQTAGRGRRGCEWVSPAGAGLLFTVLLRPSLPSARWELLTGVCGVSVARGLEALVGAPFQTRWPNDVLLAGRKVAGILVEARLPEYAVVGIGVNLLGTSDALGLPAAAATTVQEATGTALGREETLCMLLNQLDRWYGILLAGDAAAVVAAQEALDVTMGQDVTVTVRGSEVRARVVGLSATGRLSVCVDGALIELASSEAHTLRLSPSGGSA